MERQNRTAAPSRLRSVFGIAALVLLAADSRSAQAQGWPGYGRDPQHSCLGVGPSQLPQTIRWSTAVDLNPPYQGGDLLIHYGSPVITRINTVLLPVKTSVTMSPEYPDGISFRVEAHRGGDGTVIWSQDTGYALPHAANGSPAYNWIPSCGITLTPRDQSLAIPGPGGTVLLRRFPDTAGGTTSTLAFYGLANYNTNPSAFNQAIQICTPITSDRLGNLSFGYTSTGAALPGYPNGIPSGLARISSAGVGSFNSAVAISGGQNVSKVVFNCAPALSTDGSKLYVTVNSGNNTPGFLFAVNSSTLAFQSSVLLKDPRDGTAAPVLDDGSGTPTVAPDGDVYFGVLESGFPSNHARGWLLHFSGDLSATKLPSAFGWDDTASVVPAAAVPSYQGGSSYLLLTKYNNYGSAGGDGVNKLAVVDPFNSMVDPVTGATVMNTVLTVTGPTPDPAFRPGLPNAVREWCINSAAIDPANRCAVVNSEDGNVYRWDFTSNTLSPALNLAPPTGEAYTPTVIGPDGAVYAINNAKLFSCIANPGGPISPAAPSVPGVTQFGVRPR